MLAVSLIESARSLASETIAPRCAIHAEPGFYIPMTIAKGDDALSHVPPEWRSKTSTTGAATRLRGDLDVLFMDEKTDLEFFGNGFS